MAVDSDRQPGQFWLIGSQQFSFMENISESLAGRVGMQLLGLSCLEVLGQGKNINPFLPDEAVLCLAAQALHLNEKVWSVPVQYV